MGQYEVYEFLKNNPDQWFTSREISKGLEMSFGSLMMALKRLRVEKEIGYVGKGHMGSEYRYKYEEP